MKRYANGLRQVAATTVILMLLSGCGAGKKTEPDPFFETWRAKADASQGYSPRAAGQQNTEAGDAGRDETASEIKPETETEAPLPSIRITLSMHDAPIVAVLRALAKAADQSIMISDTVTGTANISAVDTPWNKVFLGVVATYGLVYERDENILKIKTAADLDKEREKEAAELRKKQIRRQRMDTEAYETEIFFIRYADAQSLGKVLSDLVKTGSLSATAAASGNDTLSGSSQRAAIMVDEASNAILAHASREKIGQIARVIEQLDRPTLQVLIEAKIVETSQDTARALGIQWGGLSLGQDGNQFQWIGGPLGDSDGSLFEESDGTPILYMPSIGNIVNFPADIDDEAGAVLGYQLQNISSDYILTMQLSALQEEGKLNILSSPSITTLDNQIASIESGREVPYQTVDEEGNINVEFKKAVLSLKVTPHIIDGDTLRLNVVTHKDELDFTNAVEGNPTIITKNAETNVILFDGQTMVIGGLSKETASDAESGVPVLKDIPVLGSLFKSTGKSSEMEEVLIFITPYILQEKPATEVSGSSMEPAAGLQQ